MKNLDEARGRLEPSQHIAVLTGAGISAESGIATFRGQDGLWKNYRPEELATPQAYAKNPELVWEWYAMRTNTVLKAEPNDAHKAIAKLAQTKNLTLVTQNVDGLHKRAETKDPHINDPHIKDQDIKDPHQHLEVLELHGNITHARCENCNHLERLKLDFNYPPICPKCSDRCRPNVVWFGESLPQETFQKAIQAFNDCDIALVIGTSAMVEPAASLARLASSQGAYVIEINPSPTALTSFANCFLQVGAVEGMQLLTE